MSEKRVWLGLALLCCACGWGSGNDSSAREQPSDAEAFPLFSLEQPERQMDQGYAALAQDAWRRELRFLDAAEPGFEFNSTRASESELEDGRFGPEEIFAMGGLLFTHNFTRAEGFGGADLPPMGRFHRGQRGGPDALRCASCHWRGGPAGAGDTADNAFFRGDGSTQSTAFVRNPPSLLGAGWKQIVAEEMTASLQATRADYVAFAKENGTSLRAPLQTHGVSFGALAVDENGELDTSELDGVDADLVVRPFGWKGTFSNLRDVVEDALNVHHGMQSEYLAANFPPEVTGDGPLKDPDGDGIEDEVSEAQVSVMTMFVAMQDVPTDVPPTLPDLVLDYARGRVAFEELGCAECHVPRLTVQQTTYELPSRTGAAGLQLNLTVDAAQPRLARGTDAAGVDVPLYSDLKRHHMGEQLAEGRADQGVDADVFLTPPLWGIARSRPYLHDGRAPTLEDAILLHGGEAQDARDAFAALSEEERAPLRVFLTSLTRGGRLVSP